MFADLSSMAAHYANLVEVQHDHKHLNQPINLGGWSFGGMVAFKVALLLQSKGFNVVNLVLFDTMTEHFKSAISSPINLHKTNDDEKMLAILARNAQLNYSDNPSVKFEGRFSLIKAADRDLNLLEAEQKTNSNCYGWNQFSSDIAIFELPGQHNTLFDESNIEQIGSLLKRILSPAEEVKKQ